MKFNFYGRDLKFFLLGVFSTFLFVIIYDWEDFEKGFLGGQQMAKEKNEAKGHLDQNP